MAQPRLIHTASAACLRRCNADANTIAGTLQVCTERGNHMHAILNAAFLQGGVQRKCPTLHPSSSYPICVGGCQRTRSRRRVKPNPDSRSFVGSKPSREGQLAIRSRKKSLRVLVGLIHFESAGPAQQRVQESRRSGEGPTFSARRFGGACVPTYRKRSFSESSTVYMDFDQRTKIFVPSSHARPCTQVPVLKCYNVTDQHSVSS